MVDNNCSRLNKSSDTKCIPQKQDNDVLHEVNDKEEQLKTNEEVKEQPEDHFSVQKELSGYKLISKIGEGAFSEVYRAIPLKDVPEGSKEPYKQVAIKIINKQKLPTRNNKKDATAIKGTSREQVLKEVVIHRAVSCCKHIVEFIEFQETESHYYIVQELLDGGEIFGEIVKYTYFSEELSRHVIRHLALAVKHIHSMGVVHRDIKPENLLFEQIDFIPSPKQKFRKSDDLKTKRDEGIFRPGIGGGTIGIVKLADFGLSKQIFTSNTKTPCGTVGYTAPEVVKDQRYSTKVDMWAIGCVLYTLLCGFPPFFDEKIDTLTELISKGQYTFLRPWWDEISDGAKSAVECLLRFDPEKRYNIDQFLNHPWILEGSSPSSSLELYQASSRPSQKTPRKIFKKDASILYSPAALAMRDAFDVFNAVQRQEDFRRNTQGLRSLAALKEDFEDEEYLNVVRSLDQELFQLCLDNSTIIKRRNVKTSEHSLSPPR